MAYQDLSAELLAHCPELGFLLAGRFVNRAFRDIRESRLWSWLTFEGVFQAPPLIGQAFNVPSTPQGTVTTTQFSNVVQLDATANAALNNLPIPFITLRQFRAGPINGGVYNIAAYDPVAATLTLDRIYQEASGTNVPYQVYRCYYFPCDNNGAYIQDFLTFTSMRNPTFGYRISRKNLHRQAAEIDAVDALRAVQGYAYFVANYKFVPTAANLGLTQPPGSPGPTSVNPGVAYELWPHPTYAAGYVYTARRRGVDMVAPTDDIPFTLSKDLLIERALYYVSEWAAKNTGRFPQLRATDWRFQQQQHNRVYQDLLRDAKRQDDELMPSDYIPDQAMDDMYISEDLQVSTLLSTQSDAGWQGG